MIRDTVINQSELMGTWWIPRHSQGLVFPGKRDSTIFLLFLSTSITLHFTKQ